MLSPSLWWKNFSLGVELDVSGTFIYNGLKAFDSLEGLNHSVEIFEVLYNISVGIERLSKIAIILIEHNDQIDIEKLEKSLITHNTIELINRVESHQRLNISSVHKEFLSILSKFYKSYRYGRFSLSSVPEIDAEKQDFLEYINKHLDIEINGKTPFFYIKNTDRIKKFVGKVIKKIIDEVYALICNKATELNIYTGELRSDSKAIKIFWGIDDRLDFIDEMNVKKELMMFLISSKLSCAHISLLKSFGSLDLDENSTPNYIKALLNDIHLHLVEGEIEQAYDDENINVKDRFKQLEAVDNEYIYGEEESDEQF